MFLVWSKSVFHARVPYFLSLVYTNRVFPQLSVNWRYKRYQIGIETPTTQQLQLDQEIKYYVDWYVLIINMSITSSNKTYYYTKQWHGTADVSYRMILCYQFNMLFKHHAFHNDHFTKSAPVVLLLLIGLFWMNVPKRLLRELSTALISSKTINRFGVLIIESQFRILVLYNQIYQ